jgi:hypothetical protein
VAENVQRTAENCPAGPETALPAARDSYRASEAPPQRPLPAPRSLFPVPFSPLPAPRLA